MRISYDAKRFEISLSERDVLRLFLGRPFTSVDVDVDGSPVRDHAATVHVESDEAHYGATFEPLSPAEEGIKAWIHSVVNEHLENSVLRRDSPRLEFAPDGQLRKITDDRARHIAMDRTRPDALIFEIEHAEIHVVAHCPGGNATILCWLGDESSTWTHFRDLTIEGDEARRLMGFR